MIRAALIGAAGVTLPAVGACSRQDTARTPTPRSEPSLIASTTVAPTTVTPSGENRTLLAYFSRSGENYWYGGRRTLDIGNTEVLATMIADRIPCDVYRIEAAEPYPSSYDDTVARNVREQDDDARPQIAGTLPDLTLFDTVVLASPIWNVRPPMIMSTFVEAAQPRGQLVLPVTTHAMSGLGRALDVYSDLAPQTTIGEGLAVQGEEVGDAAAQLDDWLARVLPM